MAEKVDVKGISKNPFFYFGLASLVLMGALFVSSGSLAASNYPSSQNVITFNAFFKNTDNLANTSPFFNQNDELALQTPDLETIENNSIYAISTPSVLTTQTLGDIFGGQDSQTKTVTDYYVQPGDTVQSVAANFNISVNTLLWANNLTLNSNLTVGQDLTILPVSGVLYIVKNGDTLSQIASAYKANVDDIIAFNSLANEQDIFIGDTLIIPGGVVPVRQVPEVINAVPLANDYFIYPAEGIITQGLHYYNAIDLANKCGTPIYAAAAGVVQRAVDNGQWNLGMGNYITILHGNGTVTYYGHETTGTIFVKSGDQVYTGQMIGRMGQTGDATGCHVHFEVIGATNPLAKYAVGTRISYTSTGNAN